MPYKIIRIGKQYCVHEMNADGSQGPQVSGGAHSTEAEAIAHVEELEQGVKEFGDSMGDFIERVRREFRRHIESIYPRPVDQIDPWVSDVFPDHCVVRAGDKYYSIAMTVTEDSITFAPRDEWVAVRLDYVQEHLEMGVIRDVMVISEFRGKYPPIPLARDIDYNELVKGDDDPVFVTLPVGKANVTSGNKRHYDDAFVKEMERQVVANHPVGLMGHLTKDERKTAFPDEAVHWVGAKRVGEFLWAKGYVPPGEPRNRLRRYKATNKLIATSISALAEGKWDQQLGAFRMNAKTLQLDQIDFAPPDRAGIADLAAVPHLTTEMLTDLSDVDSNSDDNNQEVDEMDRDEVIKGLTAADIPNMPKAVRDAIANAKIQEMRTVLELADDADIVSTVQELQKAEAERHQQAIADEITVVVNDGVKVENARGIVAELVTAKHPQTKDDVKKYFTEVVESKPVIELLGESVQGAMGPNQTNGVPGQSGGKVWFVIPKDDDQD
jgi:hypothetical protein